jgi:hypothetical protein
MGIARVIACLWLVGTVLGGCSSGGLDQEQGSDDRDRVSLVTPVTVENIHTLDFAQEMKNLAERSLDHAGVPRDSGDGWKALIDAIRILERAANELDREQPAEPPTSHRVDFSLITANEEPVITEEDRAGARALTLQFIEMIERAGIDEPLARLRSGFRGVRPLLTSEEHLDLCRELGVEDPEAEVLNAISRIEIGKTRAIGRMLLARMTLASDRGDWRSFTDHAESALAAGRMLAQQAGILEFSAGTALQALTVRTARDIIERCYVPAEDLLRLESAIRRQSGSWSTFLRLAIQSERIGAFDVVRKFFHRDGKLDVVYLERATGDLPPLLRDLMVQVETLQGNIDIIDTITGEWDTYSSELQSGLRVSAPEERTPNVTRPGTMAFIALVSLKKSVRLDMFCRIERDGTLALIACERYRQKFGRWPRGWDDLVDDFVASPLLDPMSGKPLVIRSDPESGTLLIYSIGADREDQGGMPCTHEDGPFCAGGTGCDFVLVQRGGQ